MQNIYRKAFLASAISMGITFGANAELNLSAEDKAKIQEITNKSTESQMKIESVFETPSSDLIGLKLGNDANEVKIIAFVTADFKVFIMGKVGDINGTDVSLEAENAYKAVNLALTFSKNPLSMTDEERKAYFKKETEEKVDLAEVAGEKGEGKGRGETVVLNNDDLYNYTGKLAREGHAFQTQKADNNKNMYIFFDPQCSHCKTQWKNTEYANKLKNVNVFWIPIALSSDSKIEGAAAYYLENPKGYEQTVATGEIPSETGSEENIKKIRKNKSLLSVTGSISTPTIITKTADGAQVYTGFTDMDMLTKLSDTIME